MRSSFVFHVLIVAAVMIFFTTFSSPISAADVPTLTAPAAAAIAQEDLTSRGLDSSVYIAEMVYKAHKLLGSEPAHWEVMWSKEFDAQTPGRKEIGLKIKMDGSYSRSVR